MKLSRKFLNEYLELGDITTKEIADKMTLAGNEYESIDRIASGTNLVIGYVHESIPHPNSDHLHICKVEIRPNEITQIVCGAPNVDKGQKVIVALPNAKLPDGIEIKKSVIRGEESNGMICSLKEIGLDSKYQSEEAKKGIHVLPSDAPIGEEPLKYLSFDDEIIDFDLTANRGDLLSIIGMAYEVGAIFNKKVKLKEEKIESEIDDINNYLKLDVKTSNCPLYLARMVKDVTIKESPLWLKARLIASGIRPINNVVDISNYVMLELGQPLHFFDYERLGNKIVVRMASSNEKITTLDKIERTLKDIDIVIANEKEAVALAGVMGGLNSEVENNTKDIIIESAIFDPIKVRMTSKEILRSEASSRFEKGLDPKRTYMAIDRACYLLEKYADGKVVKGLLSHDEKDKNDKIIEVKHETIENVLGLKLTNDKILEVFERLGFTAKDENKLYKVSVPTRRIDISIKEDLIEEIGRIYGMDGIIGTLPKEHIKPGKYDPIYKKEKEICKRLESLGLNQVMTYSLISESEYNTFKSENLKPYIILNPMTEDRKYMRTSLLSSLINVAEYNLSRKNNDVLIYEQSKVYYMDNDEDIMASKVSGILTGTYLMNNWQHQNIKVDFYVAKGIIENLLDYLGLKGRYTFDTENIPSYFHPYQTARIVIDRTTTGYVGLINPSLNKNKLYMFEIDLEPIFKTKIRNIKNKEISKYPSISKDVAFILDKDIPSTTIIESIKKSCGRLLTDIFVFDYYTGENIGLDKKSLAFTLKFKDMNRTLTEEEVMTLFNNMIESIKKSYNAILRDK